MAVQRVGERLGESRHLPRDHPGLGQLYQEEQHPHPRSDVLCRRYSSPQPGGLEALLCSAGQTGLEITTTTK